MNFEEELFGDERLVDPAPMGVRVVTTHHRVRLAESAVPELAGYRLALASTTAVVVVPAAAAGPQVVL